MNPPASSSSPTRRKKPRIIGHLNEGSIMGLSRNSPRAREIQPPQHLTPMPPRRSGCRGAWKALTVETGASIRPPMAAGAILPPWFFERRCLASIFAARIAFQEHPETQPRRSPYSTADVNQTGHSRRVAAEGYLRHGQYHLRQEGDAQDCPPHHHQQIAPYPNARLGPLRRGSDRN